MDIASQLGINQNLSMVRVTNRNAFTMTDRFDGILFTFRPNTPEIITHAAAMHFFGWPAERNIMKLHTMKRFGWNRQEFLGTDPNKPIDEMMREGRLLSDVYWDNIKLDVVKYALVENEAMPEREPEEEVIESGKPPSENTDLTHAGVGRKGRKLDL